VTDLRIDIPALAGVQAALQRLPALAAEAQAYVIRPLGQAYRQALIDATPVGRGEAGPGRRLSESYDLGESYTSTDAHVRITNTAPQLEYVIKGRDPVGVVRARALRFVIDGRVIFRRRVGAAKANNFPPLVIAAMQPQVDAAGPAIAAYIVRRFRG